MFCYIILHYKVYDETVSCVKSIQESNCNQKKIIIIDNFSNNGTGEQLQEFYKDDEEIDVLINDKNLGFARGNNVAYQYSKFKYKPDFIVIMNNDVEIETNNFEEKVSEIYER